MICSNSIRDYFEIFLPGRYCRRIAALSPQLVFLYKAAETGSAAEMFKRRSIAFLFGVKYLKQLKLKKALPQYHAGVADVIAHYAVTSSFFPSQPCPLQTEGEGVQNGRGKNACSTGSAEGKIWVPIKTAPENYGRRHFVTTGAANFWSFEDALVISVALKLYLMTFALTQCCTMTEFISFGDISI